MTTWNRLGQHWRKHAPTVAAVATPLAVVAGVVAVVQARMLTAQGWTVPLGNVAEWVSGVLSGLGSVAAFGALYVAISEWRTGQVERRDREAGQARLMIAELVTDRALYAEWGVTDDLLRAVVRNHSDAPVFNAIVKKEPNPMAYVTAPVLKPGATHVAGRRGRLGTGGRTDHHVHRRAPSRLGAAGQWPPSSAPHCWVTLR